MRRRSAGPRKQRVLTIVEDDPSIMLGLRINLETEGYVVLAAEDGEKALTMARGEAPDHDLVILDVMLPKLNGFQVLADDAPRRDGGADHRAQRADR